MTTDQLLALLMELADLRIRVANAETIVAARDVDISRLRRRLTELESSAGEAT